MVEVYAIKLDQHINKNVFQYLTSIISIKKQHQIKQFKRYEDAQRSLIGELLVRYIVCTNFHLTNQSLMFLLNENGKPILNCPYNIHFNISHSCEWVVCAIGFQEVGIDIERIEPIHLSIAEHFFSEGEYQYLLKQKKEKQISAFYRIWCAKESYLKALGKGLRIPLDAFTIEIAGDSIGIEKLIDSTNYHLKEIPIDKDYKLVVCSKWNQMKEKVGILPLQQVLNYFSHIATR